MNNEYLIILIKNWLLYKSEINELPKNWIRFDFNDGFISVNPKYKISQNNYLEIGKKVKH